MAQQATARRLYRSRPPQTVNTRSTVFQFAQAPADSASRQIAFNDEFLGLASALGATVLLPTPYDVHRLFDYIDQSNMLRQCIDALVTNTVLTGWEIGPMAREKAPNEGEANELQSFIDNANSEESMSGVMAKVIRDRESCGFGFVEIIRDAVGDVSILRHAQALYTRLCAKHPQDVLVEYDIQRGRRVTYVKEWRKFRRYVQVVNGRQVWFKEFGDPRTMDYRNGAFSSDDGFSPDFPATEIYHFKIASNEAYGVPRWINQLPSIIGSRESEEVNMRYFQDNTVPPMLLMVGNGRLTQQSYKELTKNINQVGIGKERQNKIMLIEAIGESDSMDGKNSTIELKVEKLSDTRQSDGLFAAYDQANMGKVRSSFRLPPVVVGMSQDVNFATASVSAFIAESQVFAPERSQIDEVLNKQLINGRRGLGLKTCKLVSRTPSITSPDMVIKSLTALNVMGAVTPRSAQTVANKMLQMELEEYPAKDSEDYEDWMDTPIIMASKVEVAPQAAAVDENGDPVLDGDGKPTVVPHPDGEVTPPVTAKGKIGKTQKGQNVKDATVKKVEKDGKVSQSAPKNGDQ